MKRVIKSATYMGQHYKYEVRWMTPSGLYALVGGSQNLQEAEAIALDNLDRIYESPWEDPERKAVFIDSLCILDDETDEDVTTDVVFDKQDTLLDMLSM